MGAIFLNYSKNNWLEFKEDFQLRVRESYGEVADMFYNGTEYLPEEVPTREELKRKGYPENQLDVALWEKISEYNNEVKETKKACHQMYAKLWRSVDKPTREVVKSHPDWKNKKVEIWEPFQTIEVEDKTVIIEQNTEAPKKHTRSKLGSGTAAASKPAPIIDVDRVKVNVVNDKLITRTKNGVKEIYISTVIDEVRIDAECDVL